MNTSKRALRLVVLATAVALEIIGVVILVASRSSNPIGDALCIGAAIVGIIWVALATVRRRRQPNN